MRGGTSRGPYFKKSDLPGDRATLSEVLLAVVGSGHSLNIDGIGGGATVTTKVAILSQSEDEWSDVDYFFAQVSVEDRLVDLLAPPPPSFDAAADSPNSPQRYERTREKMRAMLASGEMDQRRVELATEHKTVPMMFTGMGMEQMDFDMQSMFEKILPKSSSKREMTVVEAAGRVEHSGRTVFISSLCR